MMSLEDQILELSDTVELLTLDKEQLLIDKELLEEKCLQLQNQLEDALAKPSSFPASPIKNSWNVHDTIEYKKVCEESEKYKDALVRLAEASNRDREQLKVLGERVIELEKMVTDLEKYKHQAEFELDELRQNVDSMSSFEILIEKLTNDNSELAARVTEYKQTISELEDAAELNEELDQQQRKHIEEDLHTINNLTVAIGNFEQRLQEKDHQLQDYVRKLEQVKELYISSKREVDRLNILISTEFHESKQIESKLQEAVKMRVQCEDLTQELLLTKNQNFQICQQKFRYQVLFSHMDSAFGGNSYYLEESKLLNAEVLAISTLTIGLETSRCCADIMSYIVNFSASTNSSSLSIYDNRILNSLIPHLSTVYSLSMQLQSGMCNGAFRLLREQSLKQLSSNEIFHREVVQLTNLLMSGRSALGELMTLVIKIFGSLKQFVYLYEQQLNSATTSEVAASSDNLGNFGTGMEGDIAIFNSLFFDFNNSLQHMSNGFAVLVRNIFLVEQSSTVPDESTDITCPHSIAEVNKTVVGAFQHIARTDNPVLVGETVLLLMSNLIETSSLACHFKSSTFASQNDQNGIDDVLRSIKFEIDQLLKNSRKVNVALTNPSNSNVSILIDCYSQLCTLCASDYVIMKSFFGETVMEVLKSRVLNPLRKVGNNLIGELVSADSGLFYMKYYPNACIISSVRGRDQRLLAEQYQQYQEKYWFLLLQGANDLMPMSSSADLAWKQRGSDLRQVVTAKFNAIESLSDNQENSPSKGITGGNSSSPVKAVSSINSENQLVVSRYQYQQMVHELDVKKDELRAALNKCEELEKIMNQEKILSSSTGNGDAAVEKLNKEIRTLETALSTMELKSDSLVKENKQLKQQIVVLGANPESFIVDSTHATNTKEGKPSTRRRSQLDGMEKNAKPNGSNLEAEFAALLNNVPAGKSKTSGSLSGANKDSILTASQQVLNEKVLILTEQAKYWRKIAFKRVTQSLLPLETQILSNAEVGSQISAATDNLEISINSVYGNAKQDFHVAYLNLRKERARNIRIRRLSDGITDKGGDSTTVLAVANGIQSSGWRVGALQRRNNLVYKILTHGAIPMD